jgi:3-methyladenine DNA glycosylase AlkD
MATAAASVSVASIIAELKGKAREVTRKTYVRHGMNPDRVLGVNVGDMKPIQKRLKGQQDLAYALFDTGIVEAMYLAALVADGSKMTKKQLDGWASAGTVGNMIAEYAVPWVATESPHARELALKWIDAKTEHVGSTGWCTYSGIVSTWPDEELDFKEIEKLLKRIVKEIHKAPNRVRYTMNGFVIAVGIYVKLLTEEARAAAEKIGAVSVSMGDTACKVPLATDYIGKGGARGVQKKKTMKC